MLAAIYLHLDMIIIRYFHRGFCRPHKGLSEYPASGKAFGRSLIKMMKRNGLSRLPWGTPEVTLRVPTEGESIYNYALLPILQRDSSYPVM